MIPTQNFVSSLEANNINFFVGVPDSLLKDFCAYIADTYSDEQNIIAANEGNAIAIASGHYLATGNPALVYMQNSGFGNCVNPLLSLADEKVYSIPMLLVIGWRGEPGKKDEPQHVKQGEITIELLETMGIEYKVIDENTQNYSDIISEAENYMKRYKRPFALVVKKGTFEKYSKKSIPLAIEFEMSREEALKNVINTIDSNSIIVSTTGKLSRELFEYREEKGEGHEKDFLTVGSMGHSSQIALGIALSKPHKKVFCFDGDGAMIMHTGGLGIIGKLEPKNYVHIVFNNGAHESVGAQKTIGFDIDFVSIAKSFGYKYCVSIEDKNSLVLELEKINSISGPILIEVKVGINSRKNLGRPTTTPIENKEAFMNFIQS